MEGVGNLHGNELHTEGEKSDLTTWPGIAVHHAVLTALQAVPRQAEGAGGNV